MPNRFSSIIVELREKRGKLLEESKKRRAKQGSPRKKKEKKIVFESKMLEEIFNEMPKNMQEALRKKI